MLLLWYGVSWIDHGVQAQQAVKLWWPWWDDDEILLLS